MTNATIRIDGALALHSLRAIKPNISGLENDAPLFFKVRAGIQEHPVWAYDRLAIVVFCYTHVARQNTGDLSGALEVSLDGVLISHGNCANVLAKSIRWHTSSAIRRVSEQLINSFISGEVTPKTLGVQIQMSKRKPPEDVFDAIDKARGRKSRG